MGSIATYIAGDSLGNFQPMNANFGILPPLGEKIKNKQERYLKMAERSIMALENNCRIL